MLGCEHRKCMQAGGMGDVVTALAVREEGHVVGGCKHRKCAQVGGMGDVVTALARAVQEEGHDVSVILPKYDVINYAEVRAIGQFWAASSS